MRRTPRTPLIAVLLAVPALAAAGCGTSQIAADEVPGGPPVLTVPSDSGLGASGSKADAGSSSKSTADESADSGAGAAATATPPADSSGGAAAPTPTPAPQDTTGGSAPPPAGSAPEQFENFCEQNAGAC